MKYYKVINDSEFLGAGTTFDFRKFQKKHNILLACDENSAQFIQLGDDSYHDTWLIPVTSDIQYTIAQIIAIEKDEYDLLQEATTKGELITSSPSDEISEEPTEITDPIEEITLEYIKQCKISEMSRAYNDTITNGVDVLLSDGNTHHFSLTTQDQLNLMLITSLISYGETNIPYQADGEIRKFYSLEDITKISTEATNLMTYQEAYFNALKLYIESMDDMESISAITYGIQIPDNT